MGVSRLWSAFGIHARKNHEESLKKVNVQGKRIGIELSGVLHPLLFSLGREPRYARDVSCHCQGKALDNPELIVRVAAVAIDHIREISRQCTSVTVVAEGNFVLKENEGRRRKHARLTCVNEGNYRQSINVPDCAVKLVVAELTKHQIRVIFPPGEAESQLCFMLKMGVLDTIVVGSNDSDITIYEVQESSTAVIAPQVCGRQGNRMKCGQRGVSLIGNNIALQGVWKSVVISIEAATQESIDLSTLRMAGRAALAGILGHDYDELPTHGSKPMGLKGIGIVKAFRAAYRGT